jgi:hypothetical protein
MATPLGRDLRPEEKVLLASLATHQGFPVFYKLAEECCLKAQGDVVKIDPSDPNYVEQLKAAQQIARAMNQFSANLFASCNWHAGESKLEQQAERLMSQIQK